MERYEILKDIGSGNFGVAKLVRDKWSGGLYAVKYIERDSKVRTIFFLASFQLLSKVYAHDLVFVGFVSSWANLGCVFFEFMD